MRRINRLHNLILDLDKVAIRVLFPCPQKRTQDVWTPCERGEWLCEFDDGFDVDDAALVLGLEAVDAVGGVEDEAVGRFFEGDCWEARRETPWRPGAGGGCVDCRFDCFGPEGDGHRAMRQLLEALDVKATSTMRC
jgi:hypothetical protein